MYTKRETVYIPAAARGWKFRHLNNKPRDLATRWLDDYRAIDAANQINVLARSIVINHDCIQRVLVVVSTMHNMCDYRAPCFFDTAELACSQFVKV